MGNKSSWQAKTLEIAGIQLDRENPRIDARSNASQDLLRRKLLETSKVVELAQRIVDFGGLFPGERIIVTKEGDKYVALEGNRRTCACQLLVNPDLVPSDYKSSFPAADSNLRGVISQIPTEIAPSREAAEVTITQRHTSPGVLQWSPTANHRRIRRLLDRGRTLEEIAKSFGTKKSDLTRYLREGELLQHALALKCWTSDELEQISSPFVKTNPYTRFFTLEGVRNTVGIEFDKNHQIKKTKDKNIHEKWIEEIARGFLINRKGGKPKYNTRSKPAKVFEDIAEGSTLIKKDLASTKFAEKPIANQKSSFNSSSETNEPDSKVGIDKSEENTITFPVASVEAKANVENQPQAVDTPLKTVKFFETLECNVASERLIALTKEIKRIRYYDYPTASTFLARALLESSLLYCIKKKSMYGKLMKTNMSPDKKDPGLKLIIQFCIEESEVLFTNANRVRSLLNRWLKQHKDYCDLVVHGEWLKANKTTLEQLSSETFPFIQKVLNDEF